MMIKVNALANSSAPAHATISVLTHNAKMHMIKHKVAGEGDKIAFIADCHSFQYDALFAGCCGGYDANIERDYNITDWDKQDLHY